MLPRNDNGIVSRQARRSVDETVAVLSTMLRAKGITIFAIIDHSGEAAKAGLSMRPTKVIIFGNPRAGTPVMIAAPSSALDLPLKLLIREDADGKTWISFNSPEHLQWRHDIPPELMKNLAVIETLADQAVL